MVSTMSGDEPPDQVGKLAAQIQRVLQQAIGPAQENDLMHAQVVRGGALLALAACGEQAGPQVGIVAALVAARNEDIRDMRVRPAPTSARRPRIRILDRPGARR